MEMDDATRTLLLEQINGIRTMLDGINNVCNDPKPDAIIVTATRGARAEIAARLKACRGLLDANDWE